MTRSISPSCLFHLAALLLLAGCRGEQRLPVELPAPYFAIDAPILGSMRDGALDVRGDLIRHLRPQYTITNDYIFHSVRVDSSVTWNQILGVYGKEFRYAPLATSGFINRTLVSPAPDRYEFKLWSRPGVQVGLREPNDEVLVVLFMRPLPGHRFGVLQWAHLYDERIDGHQYGAPPSDLYPVKRRYINM